MRKSNRGDKILVIGLVVVVAFIAISGAFIVAHASVETPNVPVVTNASNGSGGQVQGTFGISSSSPSATLTISVLSTESSSTVNSPIITVASSTATATTTLFQLARSGQISQGGILPTVATSTGAGAGSAPVIIVGNPNDITFNLTTGTAPSASATIGTFTLPTACATGNIPEIDPANVKAIAAAAVYASSTAANTFVVVASSTALVASTNYIWNIHIGCY